jgi:hypothetical protein
MTAIKGTDVIAGYKIATTWGTAVACGAGNKLVAEIAEAQNGQQLNTIQIGSGFNMVDDVILGNTLPTVNLTMDCRYDGYFPVILSQFMGTSGSPGTEGTPAQGDYTHPITFNTSLNAKYGTLAILDSSGTVREYPTTATRSITIATNGVPGYLRATAELVSNTLSITSSTNTYSTMANVTLPTTKLVDVASADYFYINARSGGAVSGSDKLAITSFSMTLTRPQEVLPEINATAGNSTPISTGLGLEGTVTVTLRNQADQTYWTAWSAGTVYKAKFNIEGAAIGTGQNRQFAVFMPGLKLVQEPQHPINTEGDLPVTLTFQMVKPDASNPTGMSDTYPYFSIIDTTSTSFLA